MASKLSIVILCLALVVVQTTAARELPSDKSLSDQKNVFGGAGVIGGIGSNGLPYGGVISGVGSNVGGVGTGIGGGAGFGSVGGLGGLGGLGGGIGGGVGTGVGADGAGNLPLP
ncbi:glycine-rich protein 5-like [Capsicum galapagoense]